MATNIEIMRGVFEGAGLPAHVIDGILANGVWESGGRTDIDTRNQTGDGGTSWGGWQFHGPRRDDLLDFAEQEGRDWHDPELQAKFVLHELQGNESRAYRNLLNTSTAEEATEVFMRDYERPAAETANLDGRLEALGVVSGGGTALAYAEGDRRPSTGAVGAANAMGEGGQVPDESGRPWMDRFNAFLAARDRGEAPIVERIRERIRAMKGGPDAQTPVMDRIVTFFQNMGLRSAAERGIEPPAQTPERRQPLLPSILTRRPQPPAQQQPRPTITNPMEKAKLQPAPAPAAAGPVAGDQRVPPPGGNVGLPPPVAPSILPAAAPPAAAPPPPVSAPSPPPAPAAPPPTAADAAGAPGGGILAAILPAIAGAISQPAAEEAGPPSMLPSIMPPQAQPAPPPPMPDVMRTSGGGPATPPRPFGPAIFPTPMDPAAPAIRRDAPPPLEILDVVRQAGFPFGAGPTPPRGGAPSIQPSGPLPLPAMTRPNRRTGEMTGLERLMAMVRGAA